MTPEGASPGGVSLDDEGRPLSWVVLFRSGEDTERLPPWFAWWRRRIAQPGYGHVSALVFDPAADVWLWFDPKWGYVTTRAIPGAVPLESILALVPDLTEAVSVATYRGGGRKMLRWPLSCVSVVAALLGLEGRPLTPWQLRQHLVAHTERV